VAKLLQKIKVKESRSQKMVISSAALLKRSALQAQRSSNEVLFKRSALQAKRSSSEALPADYAKKIGN
jgi:hypothetical protein